MELPRRIELLYLHYQWSALPLSYGSVRPAPPFESDAYAASCAIGLGRTQVGFGGADLRRAWPAAQKERVGGDRGRRDGDLARRACQKGAVIVSAAADPFFIRAHVPQFEACVAGYRAASAATRQALRGRLGVAYGGHPDETLDLFLPDDAAPGGPRPVHLFVHGGYWRAFSKDDYSFVAATIADAGAIAAVMDYSLMPEARMATLVDQVRRAADWLGAEAAGFGGDPGAISASGHSAGAHLASYLVADGPHEPRRPDTPIRSVLLLSGLYDLEPVSRCFVQAEIRLTDDEVERWSPCRAVPHADAAVRIAYGDLETAPFRDQAADHAARLGPACRAVDSLPGEDHMSVVRALGRPGSAAARLLAETIGAARASPPGC